jgi:hypothetical protein
MTGARFRAFDLMQHITEIKPLDEVPTQRVDDAA